MFNGNFVGLFVCFNLFSKEEPMFYLKKLKLSKRLRNSYPNHFFIHGSFKNSYKKCVPNENLS